MAINLKVLGVAAATAVGALTLTAAPANAGYFHHHGHHGYHHKKVIIIKKPIYPRYIVKYHVPRYHVVRPYYRAW
jgi:hypothetical protein